MIKARCIVSAAYAGGVSRFMQIFCGLVSDMPKLPKLFASGVLIPMIEEKVIDLKNIKWCENLEDEDLEVEGHYILMAHVMVKVGRGMSVADKTKWFKDNVPTMTTKEYYGGVFNADYLKDQIRDSLECTAEEAREICSVMGIKSE